MSYFCLNGSRVFFHMITLRGALRDERVIALQYLNICYSSNHQCMQSCNIPRLICVSTITVRKNLFLLECVFCCNSRLVYMQRWCEGRPVECECPQPSSHHQGHHVLQTPGRCRANMFPAGCRQLQEPDLENANHSECDSTSEGSLWVKLVYSVTCFITVNDTYHPLVIAGLGLLLLAHNKFMLHRPQVSEWLVLISTRAGSASSIK